MTQAFGEVGAQVGLIFSKAPGLATLLMPPGPPVPTSVTRGIGGGDDLPVTQVLPYLSMLGVSQQRPCLGGDR